MRRERLEACLESYLDELKQRKGLAKLLAALANEFLPGLACLARYGFVSIGELHGELGQELLHELVCDILAGKLPRDPAKGDILRALGRVAYARLRRDRRLVQLGSEAYEADGASAARDTPVIATAPSPVTDIEDRNNVPVTLQGLLREVEDADNRKGRGSLHYGRVGQAMKLAPKRLRLELKKLGHALGRDGEHEAFWLNRLRECLVELLRLRTEALSPDVLPREFSDERLVRRLLRVLSQLSHSAPPANARRALSIVRRMERERSYPRKQLREAALLLETAPVLIGVMDAECLLASSRAQEAWAVLSTMEKPRVPIHGSLARQHLVLALTRARCLEALGQFEAASNLLEEAAGLQRRDALFCYNRLVLAERAGLFARLSRAHSELELIMSKCPRLPARLLKHIRIAADRARKVLAANA